MREFLKGLELEKDVIDKIMVEYGKGINVEKEKYNSLEASEVMSSVNDDTDFETALKNYKNDNPQYFGETVVKKVQTSPVLNNGGNQSETTNDIMNNILRGSRN